LQTAMVLAFVDVLDSGCHGVGAVFDALHAYRRTQHMAT
jgi:hypothetical protein